jgi:hypothetical protein
MAQADSDNSTRTPAAAGNSELPRGASAIQKAAAAFERAFADQEAKYQIFFAAERAAVKAAPPVPALLRPTKKNMADIADPFNDAKGGRCAIRAAEIERDINALKRNTCHREDLPNGMMVLTMSAKPPFKPFPLTAKQKAHLARLERRLPIARAREAAIAKIDARFRVRDLERAAGDVSVKLMKLASKLTDTPSKTRDDILAKARVFQLDREICEELGTVICDDLIRLNAAALI